MENYLKKIKETTDWVRFKTMFEPEVAIVLGSGLGNLISRMEVKHEMSYEDVPHFPVSTVKGHYGKLLFGTLHNRQVVVMSGRFHYYEGYTMEEVSFPIRVLHMLGCHSIIITNASGGLNPEIRVGDLCVITDHINMQPGNPLIGKNLEELGPRFPDQHAVYDKGLISLAVSIAKEEKIRLHTGVYVAVPGPTFETPAEYKMYRLLGGDCIGMSTVPEVLVANHGGMRIFAISVICDEGNPAEPVRISHEEVVAAAQAAEPRMTRIIDAIIQKM